MKRGRPLADDYPRADFVTDLLWYASAAGISQTALADRSFICRDGQLVSVNRGNLSRIILHNRHATAEERLALARTANFPLDLVAKYSRQSRPVPQTSEAQLITDYNYPRLPLIRPVTLLVRGFYPSAYQALRSIFSVAAGSDLVLAADAAARLAWLHLQIGFLKEAMVWVVRSITSCEKANKHPVEALIHSAAPVRSYDRGSETATLLRILSDALHLRGQILATRLLYSEDEETEEERVDWEASANTAVDSSLALDRRLELPEPIGNGLRWKALIKAAGDQPDFKSAIRLIDEAKDNFAHGGLYEAHLVSARGVINLRAGKLKRSQDKLTDAKDRLSSRTDSRGLALNLCALSDVCLLVSDRENERRVPVRYMLAASALHPYGFIVERCRREARLLERREFQREIDDLFDGKGAYQPVHRMMARLAKDSPHAPTDLLYRNMNIMLAAGFPQVETPFRQEPRNAEAR